MVPIANSQADQMQALKNFHGYRLDFFTAVKGLPIFHELLSMITKLLDCYRKALVHCNEPLGKTC